MKTSGRQSGGSALQSTIPNPATGQFRALIFALTTEVSWSFSDSVTSIFLHIPLQNSRFLREAIHRHRTRRAGREDARFADIVMRRTQNDPLSPDAAFQEKRSCFSWVGVLGQGGPGMAALPIGPGSA